MSEEIRDRKKIERGIRQLSKNCPACGRPKLRHSILEAKQCKYVIDHEDIETRVGPPYTKEDIQNIQPRRW